MNLNQFGFNDLPSTESYEELLLGLESGNDKPGLLRRIWNAIIKFFKKIWSKISRQGYRAKELVMWENTKISKGYEDEEIRGIPLKYAEYYEQYVSKYISLVQPASLNVVNAFEQLKSSPTDKYLKHLNECLQQEINSYQKCLQFTTPNIPQSIITAKEVLLSMTKITLAEKRLQQSLEKFPGYQYEFDQDNFPNVDKNILNNTFNLMGQLNTLIDKTIRYDELIEQAIHAFNLSVNENEATFVKIFTPKDRSKAQNAYKENATESYKLDYLLSL